MCTPGNLHRGGSYSALRVGSQTWPGVTFSLLVSSAFVNICVFILHLWLLNSLVYCSTAHRRTQGFVLSFFEASGCTLAHLWVSPSLYPATKIKHIPVTTRREVPVSCPLAVGNVTVLCCPYSSNSQYIILGVATDYPSHWACKYLYFLVQSWANPVSKQPERALWHLPSKAGASVSLLDTQDMHCSASFALLSATRSVVHNLPGVPVSSWSLHSCPDVQQLNDGLMKTSKCRCLSPFCFLSPYQVNISNFIPNFQEADKG